MTAFIVNVGEDCAEERFGALENALLFALAAARVRKLVTLWAENATCCMVLQVWEEGK